MLLSLKHIFKELFYHVLGPIKADALFTPARDLNYMSRGGCCLTFPHHLAGKDLSTHACAGVIDCINQEALLVMIGLVLVPHIFSKMMLEFLVCVIPWIKPILGRPLMR